MISFEEALSNAEKIVKDGYSIEKYGELSKYLVLINQPPEPFPEPPTHAQLMRLFHLGVEILYQGYYTTGPDIDTLYLFTGLLWTLHLDLDASGFDDRFTRMYSIGKDPAMVIFTNLLKNFIERICSPFESVQYMERAFVEIGGFNRHRVGDIILTNTRFFIIGSEYIRTTSYAERNYLWYPDLTEKSYYGCLDYIPIEKIAGVEVKYGRKDTKLMLYLQDIDYIKVKPRYFHGPLFFKMRLSDKVVQKAGTLDLAVRFIKYKDETKEEHRARYERLKEIFLSL